MITEYDKKAKERQEQILSKVNRAHTYVEKPMMKSMMRDLSNNRVLLLESVTRVIVVIPLFFINDVRIIIIIVLLIISIEFIIYSTLKKDKRLY